ncbi:acetyltransferase [Actinoplanes awajinensis subsp. mycoplanecinus]|uniref:Acetyltransferase n=1 Tax=Actinoplanes awajinensis subsp. mycoplanecinus TaxID=135947 RepID=A0A101JS22_9ACTN|nr:acetyltransferase [Actinoplanes awajinensis subsp. mycoplanecinus]
MAVVLRPLRFEDWPAVHEWARRPEVCVYQAWGPNTPDETREFARVAAQAWDERPQQRFPYAIVRDGRTVGNVELFLRSEGVGEIGYLVHPEFWGRGVATSAARELLTLGFTEHGLHRIFATCDPRNVASAAVLRRLGMRYEGRMRETHLIRDGWRDSDLYAILAPEWRGAVDVPRPSSASRPDRDAAAGS